MTTDPTTTSSRLTRHTDAQGRRTARVEMRDRAPVTFADVADGAVAVHTGPLMLPWVERDDVAVDADGGVVTVRLGAGRLLDATADATDGAWQQALTWVLDGEQP